MYRLVKLHNYTAGAVKFCYVKYFVLFSGIVYLTGFSCFVLFLRKKQSLQELIFFAGKVVTSLWLPELCALGICKKNRLPNELHSVVSRSTNVFDVCRTSVRDGASYCLVVYRKSWKEKLPKLLGNRKERLTDIESIMPVGTFIQHWGKPCRKSADTYVHGTFWRSFLNPITLSQWEAMTFSMEKCQFSCVRWCSLLLWIN